MPLAYKEDWTLLRVANALRRILARFFRRAFVSAANGMAEVPTSMKLPITRSALSLALALAYALLGAAFTRANNGPEISHEAAKLNQRGLDHLHKKEYDQAITSFREALKIQPEFPDALDNLGKALEATGKDADAIAAFDKAIKIAPEKAAVYADKGMALFHEGKYEDAAAAYRQALEHHKDFSEAQNGLGAALLHLGKNEDRKSVV